MIDNIKIKKAGNGWILIYERPFGDPVVLIGSDTYVFSTSKKLAKFIKKLDEKGSENESNR